jgi:hypothetical protein
MREGFEAKPWSEAWERDIDSPAEKVFSALMPDRGIKVCYRNRRSPIAYAHLLL